MVTVYDIVVVPVPIPLTDPEEEPTVATAVLVLLHTPPLAPVASDKVIEPLTLTTEGPVMVPVVGGLTIVITAFPVIGLVQLVVASVAKTVYVAAVV